RPRSIRFPYTTLFRSLTAGDLERKRIDREQAYVVGPPRFFPSSLVTAPVTESVSFILPAWFSDRRLLHSAIAPYADGAIHLQSRSEEHTSELQSRFDL